MGDTQIQEVQGPGLRLQEEEEGETGLLDSEAFLREILGEMPLLRQHRLREGDLLRQAQGTVPGCQEIGAYALQEMRFPLVIGSHHEGISNGQAARKKEEMMPRIFDIALYGFAALGALTALSYLVYWLNEVFL